MQPSCVGIYFHFYPFYTFLLQLDNLRTSLAPTRGRQEIFLSIVIVILCSFNLARPIPPLNTFLVKDI